MESKIFDLCELCNDKIIQQMKFPPGYGMSFKDNCGTYSIRVSNSFNNITECNNAFCYTFEQYDKTEHKMKQTNYFLTIPEGAYELDKLNETLQKRMKELYGHEHAIEFFVDINQKVVLVVKPNYSVIFKKNTFNNILGFNYDRYYHSGCHISEKANIMGRD